MVHPGESTVAHPGESSVDHPGKAMCLSLLKATWPTLGKLWFIQGKLHGSSWRKGLQASIHGLNIHKKFLLSPSQLFLCLFPEGVHFLPVVVSLALAIWMTNLVNIIMYSGKGHSEFVYLPLKFCLATFPLLWMSHESSRHTDPHPLLTWMMLYLTKIYLIRYIFHVY